MNKTYQNGEQYFHKLYTKFNAFIAITLLPMAWLLLEKQIGRLQPTLDGLMLWSLIIALIFSESAIIFHAIKSFKKELKRTSPSATLREKLDVYYQVSTKKYVFFLLAGMICVVGMWITVNTIFIVGYIVSLIFLSLGRPTLSAFFDDLSLSEEEQNILLDKKEIE